MKKRLTAGIAAALSACMLLAGCEASKGLETDEIKISQYKGVEVTEVGEPEEVTDEDVEDNIQSALEMQAESKEITDRPVADGDTVNIDFVGKIDGEEFEGGSAEDYLLTIGSDVFIDGFEDSVIGHNIGETYDWNGKFPDDYGSAEYAGKDVVFTITVNSITTQEIPELNDEFVKNVSENSKTVEEYREEVRDNLTKSNEASRKSELQSSVWQAVLDNTEVLKYPEEKVEKKKSEFIEQYKSLASYTGMDFEEYLEGSLGIDEETFEEKAGDVARRAVKEEMALHAIADKEKIALDDKGYEEQYKIIADTYDFESVDALKEAASEEELKNMALLNVVLDWLTERCIQVAAD